MNSPKQVFTKIKKIDADELTQLKKRTDAATLVIIFFIAVIITRLWFLQIHNGAEYSEQADNNRVRMLDVVAPRGNIMDTNGRTIITNRPSFNVVWVKEDSPDPDQIIKKLSLILDEEIAVLLKRVRESLDNPRHIPILLKEDIDWKTLVYIENNHYDLPGVRIEVLPRRNYLFGDFGSHLIGYTGEINLEELKQRKWENYQGGDQIGKRGFEKLYEEELRGDKGTVYMEVDAHGFEQRQLKGKEPLPGNDLQLTIDLDLQLEAEKAMADKAGAVVAMDVKSGRILAFVSAPPVHLEDFVGGISTKNWQSLLNNIKRPLVHKTIQGQYPPGSTYKIVTALAGLSKGVINPNTVFYCSGSMAFGNRRYGCWKKGGHGPVNLHRALAESCDIYFYQVGLRVGVDSLAEYANRLGLGHKTGIAFEYEKSGLIPTSNWKKLARGEPWQEGETLSIAIGQGFNLVTPLQVCQMTSALANGGILYKPFLVEKIIDPEGQVVKQFDPEVDVELIGMDNYLELVREGLVAAVNGKHGTGREARLKEITVAGKTGTAQVVTMEKFKEVDEEDVAYKHRDHAWFTSFAPAEAPEIAVTVLVEHGGHGGSAAAPVAKKVLEKYFAKKTELKTEDVKDGQASLH
ncbi:MAG: penicillin-binding protein [Desulfobacterales bacterium SG8_35]|nr:MAG: penicillin-binding protein [Desulfobacterales bacterium SG8_35]